MIRVKDKPSRYNIQSARLEEASIYCEFDVDRLSPNDIEVVKQCLDEVVEMLPGDTISFSYNFEVEYFGVVRAFLTILNILDKASIVKVKTEELLKGRCLAQELFCRLEQIEKKFCKGTNGEA